MMKKFLLFIALMATMTAMADTPMWMRYARISPDGNKIGGSIDFCKYLLESEGLAIVPGAAFGDDTCVRFSYAASDESLAKACDRFERGVKSLRE